MTSLSRAVVILVALLLAAAPAAADITIGAVGIRDGSGNTVGKIDSDGSVRSDAGNSVGKIETDGSIRNGSGNSIGRVDGYSSELRHEIAALLFFFDAVRGLK